MGAIYGLQIWLPEVGKWMVVEREAVGLCEGMSDCASCKTEDRRLFEVL